MYWLIFATADEFAVLNSYMNSVFGYPDGVTTTYTEPIINGSQFGMLIEDRCLPYLTPEQTANLQSAAQMQSIGWLQSPRRS